MTNIELNEIDLILHIRPEGPLEKDDFERIANTVDPVIDKEGKLNGIIMESESFPGWKSIGAMIEHFKFIKNHHKKVKKVALVTNSKIAEIMKKLTEHFVEAEVKHFDAGQAQMALDWVKSKESANVS